MKHLQICVPSPVEPDKKLSSRYEKLNEAVGELAAQREAANIRPIAPYAAVTLETATANLRNLETEYSLLKAEVPVWKQVPEYVAECVKSRQNAALVATELLEAARQQVRAIFDRDFDPKVWSIREAALSHYISNHPCVLGAQDHLAEVKSSGEEAGARVEAERTIAIAEDRLAKLPAIIEAAKKQVRTIIDAAARRDEEQREETELAAKRQAEAEAVRQRAAQEARRRLAAAR